MTKHDVRAWLISALATAAGGAAIYDGTRTVGGDASCRTNTEACGLHPSSSPRENGDGEQAMTGPRLLVFSSTYCPACERVKPVLADVERACDAADVVAHVDVDRSEWLAARYAVAALPTFVTIDASGGVVTRLVGVQSRDVLERALEDVRGARCPAGENEARTKAL